MFPCVSRLARVGCPAPRSQPGGRSGVRNRACHGAAPRHSAALGVLPRPSLHPPRLVSSTFCLPKATSLTHRSRAQPLSPLPPPSSSLLGAAHASGEQLVAHSSPGLGGSAGGRGVGGCSPSLLSCGPEARGAGTGTAATQGEPRSLFPGASAAAKSIRAPRLSRLSEEAQGLADREHKPRPDPLARPRPPGRVAPPLQEPSQGANPAPRFRGTPRPAYHPGPAHFAPGL